MFHNVVLVHLIFDYYLPPCHFGRKIVVDFQMDECILRDDNTKWVGITGDTRFSQFCIKNYLVLQITKMLIRDTQLCPEFLRSYFYGLQLLNFGL